MLLSLKAVPVGTYDIKKINEGFSAGPPCGPSGACRRAAKALQDLHANGGYLGINEEAVVALANANGWSSRTWQPALAKAKEELASERVWVAGTRAADPVLLQFARAGLHFLEQPRSMAITGLSRERPKEINLIRKERPQRE